MKNLKLAFINALGKDVNGYINYEFLFTEDIDDVWGEDWEVKPAGICNISSLESNLYNKNYILETNLILELAQNCNCFSMNDCTDGIIPLCWEDISDYEEYPEDGRFIVHFGENLADVNYKLAQKGLNFKNISEDYF